MTEEEIKKRKAELEAARDQIAANIKQLQANYQATVGAIQDCEFWLAELAKAKKEVKK